jgi:hypothetical protein
MLLGSYEDGIEMNDGLPIDGPPLVGPKVGVEEADLAVAGEVSVLPWSNVTVLSTWPCCRCSECCNVIFKNEAGVAGATSTLGATERF